MSSKQSDSKSDIKSDSDKFSDNKSDIKCDTEFRNVGYSNWLQLRRDWLQKKQPGEGAVVNGSSRVVAKSIDVDDVIERIYSNASNGVLKEPIPLGQMIDLLIDFWEADGLYD